MLYLGPIMLIGGLIEHGWTTDALIPLLALLIFAVFFPLVMGLIAIFLIGIFS